MNKWIIIKIIFGLALMVFLAALAKNLKPIETPNLSVPTMSQEQ